MHVFYTTYTVCTYCTSSVLYMCTMLQYIQYICGVWCSGLLDVARRTYTETVDDIAGMVHVVVILATKTHVWHVGAESNVCVLLMKWHLETF